MNFRCADREIVHCRRRTKYFHSVDLGVDVIAWLEHATIDIYVHLSIKNLRDVQTAIAPVIHGECVNVLSINFAKNSRADSANFDQFIPRYDMKLINLRF